MRSGSDKIFIFLLLLFLSFKGTAATFYSRVATGNWGIAGTWSTVACGGVSSGTIPGAGDDVIICNGHTITLEASRSITNVTINAGGQLAISGAGGGGYDLTLSGNLTIEGTLYFSTTGAADKLITLGAGSTINIGTTGLIDMTTGEGDFTVGAGSFFNIVGNGQLIWNPNTNTAAGTTIFTNTTENLSATCTLDIRKWYDGEVPLGQVVSGDFGNVILNVSGLTWQQDGQFSPNRIKGNLTVSNGLVVFDDGTGSSTVLTIGASGTGSITLNSNAQTRFQTGANRNFNLTCGNFSHTAAFVCEIMYQSYGTLIWQVNGNATISNDFTALQAGGTPVASACNVTITGNLTIDGAGNNFDFIRSFSGTTSPAVVTVGGATTISAGGWTRFIDAGNGDLTFSTNSLSVTKPVNFKYGSDQAVTGGNASFTVTNNLNITAGADLYILGDQNCTAGPDIIACTQGGGSSQTVTVNIGSLTTDANFSNAFYALCTRTEGTGGVVSATFGSINWQGGNFILHNANHSGGGLCNMNVTGNYDLNFTNGTDQTILINNIAEGSTNNNIGLNFDVGGDFTISGNTASATFRGSASTGNSTFDVIGSMNMGGGYKSRIVSGTAGHNLSFNVGALNVSNGSFWLSYRPGTVTAAVSGNVTVSSGTFGIKGDLGASTFTVNGNFEQTGGTFGLYDDDNLINMTNVVAVTINGDFTHTGGTLNFDDRSTSTATHTLTHNGSNFTVGGTGSVTRAGAGTGSVFGEIYFNKTGTTTYARSATTHQLQQVKYFINSVCTLDVSSTAQNFQLASNSTRNNISGTNAKWAINVDGILNLGTKKIEGLSVSDYYSGVYVRNGGTLQTANTSGFYDGTTNANLQPDVYTAAGTGWRMDFNFDANSTIEYNGSANQVVTGKYPTNIGVSSTASDIVAGTTASYKYGKLKINQTTLGIDARAAASNIFVRTQLILENGEFDLNPSGTGYTAVIENGLSTGLLRNNSAYVRSETENAILQWKIDNNTGTYVFPFGYDDTRYVPFSANVTTGVAGGSFLVSTWYTAANAAVPTGVTVCSALSDPDEQYATDRFYVITPTAGYTADITFYYTTGSSSVELDGIAEADLKAQRWNSASGLACKWEPPVGTVNTTGKYVQVDGVSSFSPWVLSKGPTPLPVELLSFTAYSFDKQIELNWSAATEINNDYFTVERSKDGEEFEPVSKVKSRAAGGNSNIQIDYSVKDKRPFSGVSYYRLRQTDFDGKYSYSDIVAVELKEGKESLYVYPIPAKNQLNLPAGDYENAEIKIYDVTGQLVYTTSLPATPLPLSAIDISYLPKGVYFISLSDSGNIRYARFLKE